MLKIIKGDDTSIEVTFKDEDDQAIDLTGATVFFTVKKNIDDADDDALIKKDVTTHTDPAAGKTTITLSNTDTNVETGRHSWDLQIKYSNGKIQSIPAGKVEISQDITQRTS